MISKSRIRENDKEDVYSNREERRDDCVEDQREVVKKYWFWRHFVCFGWSRVDLQCCVVVCETSGIQQNDSVMHMYVYTHTHTHTHTQVITRYWAESPMLYSRVLVNHLFYAFVVVQLLSRVQLFETSWTAAHQVPLSSTISEFA